MSINWGDGSDVVSDCIPVDTTAPRHPFERPCEDTPGNGLQLQRDHDYFVFDASHTYAEPGTYFGTMWIADGVTATSETFTMTIRETPDVLVTTNTADGVVRVAEHGATSDTVDVRLAEAPTEDVTVTFDTAIPHQVDVPEPLTFTPDDWNQPRTVTIRAVDDNVDETDPHSTSVAVSVDEGATEAHVSIDGTRSSMSSNLPVQVADNDGAGLLVSPNSFVLTEGGPSTTLTVELATDPANGGVTVTTTASGGCTVTPATLFFKRTGEQESLTVTPPERDQPPATRRAP